MVGRCPTGLDYYFTLIRNVTECRQLIGETHSEERTSNDNAYLQIFRVKTVHLIALFVLTYVGVEVTIGGALTY